MRLPAVISLLSVVGLLAASGPAAARPACGEAVIADWSDGRIDAVYAPACYAKALDALPEDVRAYSTAVDDISRALRARIRADTRRAPATPRAGLGEPADGSRRLSVRGASQARDEATLPHASVLAEASPLPLPLLSAAAVALVLCVAGSASVLARRRRARVAHPRRRPVGQC